jgi:hypothetical protein
VTKVKIKVVNGWNGGHQVEFSIGVQSFRLEEVFANEDNGMTSFEYAKWYKKQLHTAFSKLSKIGNTD